MAAVQLRPEQGKIDLALMQNLQRYFQFPELAIKSRTISLTGLLRDSACVPSALTHTVPVSLSGQFGISFAGWYYFTSAAVWCLQPR